MGEYGLGVATELRNYGDDTPDTSNLKPSYIVRTKYKHTVVSMPATERFALRMEDSEKKKIARISKKLKVSNSEFVKRAIDYYIRYLNVLESETITLTREEFSVLRVLLNSDEEPNHRLLAAAKSYREFELRRANGSSE